MGGTVTVWVSVLRLLRQQVEKVLDKLVGVCSKTVWLVYMEGHHSKPKFIKGQCVKY